MVGIDREQAVGRVVALVRRDEFLAHMATGQAYLRSEVIAAIDIKAFVIAFVREVRLNVVLKAVYPGIVVGIDAEEKFRPVHVLAQEGLFVVGNQVDDAAVVVLVEVGNEIVVFIPPREDRRVSCQGVIAAPVGNAVLVVVILDEFH